MIKMSDIKSKFHTPVLVDEVLKHLDLKDGDVFVDGTLGGGGHALALLENFQFSIFNFQLVGIDRDQEAINEAKKNLKQFSNIAYVNDNFANLDKILKDQKIEKVDAILLDLGVSSHQLDDVSRGFSFKDNARDVPLNMRMDNKNGLMASDVLNSYTRERLAEIFLVYGGIRIHKQLASVIYKRRRKMKFETVGDLLDFLIREGFDKRLKKGRVHFATDIFRALRIEVNEEFTSLISFIPKAIKALKPNKRLAIITFHSDEDRIVKHSFKLAASKELNLVKIITKKPITPTRKELSINPRSRSAKLRVVEKVYTNG